MDVQAVPPAFCLSENADFLQCDAGKLHSGIPFQL
jgi:hypothetical protein